MLDTLNAGATWRAKGDEMPKEVEQAFDHFTRLVGSGDEGRVTDGISDISKAYFSFWQLSNKFGGPSC